MHNLFQILLLCLLMFASIDAHCDIGETFDMKEQRKSLVTQLEQLKSDSSLAMPERLRKERELSHAILQLDEHIFSSYDETVARMASQRWNYGSNGKSSILLAMITTIAALFLFLLLWMARKRMIASGKNGITDFYIGLTRELVGTFSSEKVTSKKLLRVNIVVIFGLIVMSISVLAFLMNTL